MKIPFITAYGEKRKSRVVPRGTSMAHQSMKDECDINVIMARYKKTGLIEHVRMYQGQYGDFGEMDFHEAMNLVTRAQEMFETVPAEIRAQFGNDPGAFLNFVNDEKNGDKLIEMGLRKAPRAPAEPEPAAEPAKAEPAAATAPAASQPAQDS
jgi:phage internal scaffolding protein